MKSSIAEITCDMIVLKVQCNHCHKLVRPCLRDIHWICGTYGSKWSDNPCGCSRHFRNSYSLIGVLNTTGKCHCNFPGIEETHAPTKFCFAPLYWLAIWVFPYMV